MADTKDRRLRFDAKMSDAEALMWQVEKDPWLNPSGGVVVFLDRAVDPDRFRASIAYAVSKIPRLVERVVSPVGRVANPEWVPDEEFDFDWHVRHVALPAPGSDRQVLDLATRLLEDPYDRTRPLWQFVMIDGLEGGRGAVFWKLHHTLMDGKAAIRLTELFTQLDRDAPPPPPVDLAAVVAEAVAAHRSRAGERAGGTDGGDANASVTSAIGAVSAAVRGPLGVLRRLGAEAMLAGADPSRVTDLGTQAAASAGQLRDVLAPPTPAGSTLWADRSRRRRAEVVTLPLDAVRATARALGGTVNDVFVAGVLNGVVAFHEAHAVTLDHLTFSFIVSTRTDDAIGGNAFTPTIERCALSSTTALERFERVRELLHAGRESVGAGSGLIGSVAALAKLLPTSAVTTFGRRQAAAVDFATSNLRGTPVTAYIAGARLERNVTLGPVAGTAFNATALSMVNTLDIGLHLDAGAIEEPERLVTCIEQAFAELFRLAGVAGAKAAPAKKAATAKKAPAKQPTKRPAASTTPRRRA